MAKQQPITHTLWLARTKFLRSVKAASFFLKRKVRAGYRQVFGAPTAKNSYTFAILCIKKPVYGDLIARQANSLHYFNPTHRFIVYADDICADVLEKNLRLFDYPKQITIKRAFGTATKPWQIYKMDMRLENARQGGIDIDADMFWHDDPVIDRTRPVMFAPARTFKEHKAESDVMLQVFNKPEWLSFTHFVSAFVSIPQKFMTEKLAQDAKTYVQMMLDHPLSFIPDQDDRDEIRRVSEEIGICLALQSNYPGMTEPLKRDGGKKDKQLLEPIYYGSENRVIA